MFLRHLLPLLLPTFVGSQSTTPAASPTILTTTLLTLLPPSSSGAPSVTSTLLLTLTLSPTPTPTTNTSAFPAGTTQLTLPGNITAVLFPNGTELLPNGTRILPNGTEIAANGSVLNPPVAYDGKGLSFHPVLDAGIGVGGGVLMISGAVLATLGGKNKWSSMAIVSSYTFLLLTLLLLLSIGILPSLSPPSPNPPSHTLIGLYTLACLLAALIGGGLGVFLYQWVRLGVPLVAGAAGGWWVLGLHGGGVGGGSLIARWGIIVGAAVLIFIPSLHPKLQSHASILSSAWIGSLAFTLGLDVFTRQGLKEFYLYNLGYSGLFDQGLAGWGYPLTEAMIVEQAVVVVLFLMGSAIQYKILGTLHTKLLTIKAEEAARKEAEADEANKKRFEGVDTERSEWEEKYSGSGGSPSGSAKAKEQELKELELGGVETLDKYGRPSSTYSLLGRNTLRRSGDGFEELTLDSPGLGGGSGGSSGGRSVGAQQVVEMKGDEDGPMDDELKDKLRLLNEVRSARSSIEALRRAGTPTLPQSAGSMRRSMDVGTIGRPGSRASLRSAVGSPVLDTKSAEWNDYLSDRKLFTPPIGVSPPIPTSTIPLTAPDGPANLGRLSRISPGVMDALDRRQRTMSAYEMGDLAEMGMGGGAVGDDLEGGRKRFSTYSPGMGMDAPRASYSGDRPSYIVSPTTGSSAGRSPTITGHAYNPTSISKRDSATIDARPQNRRSITFEELSLRHKAKLSQLQNPLTEVLKSEVALAETKAEFERKQERERAAMVQKEKERALGSQRKREPSQTSNVDESLKLDTIPQSNSADRAASWRKSVAAEVEPAAVGSFSKVKRLSRTGEPKLSMLNGPGEMGERRRPQLAVGTQGSSGTMGKRISRGPDHFVN